jgi:AraC-like DNA-binding protein
MMNDGAVRFWQPAPQAATQLACAYLELGRVRPHLHEEWQFAVPECPAKLSVGAFRRYPAGATDITVVAPYEVHTEGGAAGPPPRWRVLYVAPSILTDVYRRLPGATGYDTPRLSGPVLVDRSGALELGALLRASEDGKIDGSEFLARALHWLEQLLHRHAGEVAIPARMPAVERARAYLQERPTQPVSLPEVGAVAGVTVSHLVRSFSRAVGLPPKSYHAQIRLARARRLLGQGKSATWVAYECGFADQSHLSRRFRESYGLTPGTFQAQYRQERVAAAIVTSSGRLTGVDSNAA